MEVHFTKKEQMELEKNYEEALKDENFKKLVNSLKCDKKQMMKKTSKLQDTIEELSHCKNCKGLYECKNKLLGHVSMPKIENQSIIFTYIPCKYKKEEFLNKLHKKSEEKINETARMKDIDVSDKKRIHVIKWLDTFYETYEYQKNMKGLYLHGNFGCGKTFLISALFHELQEKKNVKVLITYYPELLRKLKSDWENYEYQMKELQTIDILCFDDIGAEKVSEWARDEVLGTILQSRMTDNLTTFFTSNLNLEELENHFLLNSSKEEKIKSRRIMERIRQLSLDMELLSENRRN